MYDLFLVKRNKNSAFFMLMALMINSLWKVNLQYGIHISYQ